MNATADPLEAKDMLKSATIYRNSEFSYVYVCFHCECSFTNITDTLSHVESHFDVKMNIEDHLRLSGMVTELLCEPQLLHTDSTTESGSFLQNDGILTKDDGPGKLACKIVEDKHCQYYENNQEDIKKDFAEQSTNLHCTLCYQTFAIAAALIVHMTEEHATTTTLTCSQCSENCDNETTFSTHLQQHIDANDTTRDALMDKLISKRKIKVEKCLGKQKTEKKCLKVCDICSETFRTKEYLIKHMRREHITQAVVKKQYFDCEKCQRKIEGKFAFYAHQYGHLTNDDRVNAPDDEILQKDLKKYIDDNISCDESTPRKTFGCRVCAQLAFKQRTSAQYHILQQHIFLLRESQIKRFACEYCGRKFAHSNNLKVHKRIHTLERPYTCLICNKSFAQSNLMKYHEKIHAGVLPHQCSICGATFRSNSKLNFHIKCHSNITKKCPICSKELKEHRLKLHIRNVHENEYRPFKCPVCLQAFKTKKTLKTHSYRHTGEKRFECRLHCKEKFVSAASRRAHERTKHEAL